MWSNCTAQSFNIELLDNWQDDDILVNSSLARYNDCWGYTQENREYALVGSTIGTHALSISNSGQFQEIDFVPGKYQSSMVVHRDIKTYLNYAYSVCDEGESSLQIIDLTYLPDSLHLVAEHISRFSRVHNIFIDENNAILYACGPTHIDTASGISLAYTLDVYSLADPLNPSLLWESDPSSFPYVHDCFVREGIAYLNCGDDGLRVFDFTNPSTPIFLQNITIYQDQGYNHQGWLSPDGGTYIFGDETTGKKLKRCSVKPDHTITIDRTFGTNSENGSIAHNIMLSDRFAYVAYYNEGLRIYDLSEPVPKEIAYFDTYPDETVYKMNGAWGIYTQLPSSRILVSDRQYGLFLLDFNEEVFESVSPEEALVYPNPVLNNQTLFIRVEESDLDELSMRIFSTDGKTHMTVTVFNQSFVACPIQLNSGVYYARISHTNYLGEEVVFIKKFEVLN